MARVDEQPEATFFECLTLSSVMVAARLPCVASYCSSCEMRVARLVSTPPHSVRSSSGILCSIRATKKPCRPRSSAHSISTDGIPSSSSDASSSSAVADAGGIFGGEFCAR